MIDRLNALQEPLDEVSVLLVEFESTKARDDVFGKDCFAGIVGRGIEMVLKDLERGSDVLIVGYRPIRLE